MNKTKRSVQTLIDPMALVVNPQSSTRALKLIHRALLSHLMHLAKNRNSRMPIVIEGESYETEYNSTAQLAEDIGNYIQKRTDDE